MGGTRMISARRARSGLMGVAALGWAAAAGAQQLPVVAPPLAGAPVVVPAVPYPGTPAVAAGDEAAWAAASRAGTTEALRAYVASFPAGAHVAEARALMGQLAAGTPPGALLGAAPIVEPPVVPDGTAASTAAAVAAPTAPAASGAGSTAQTAEAGLGLSVASRRAIQSALSAKGYDTRGIDGQFGSGTRRAITAWQTARGYTPTGYLTATQAEALQAEGTPGAVTPPGPTAAAGTPARDAGAEAGLTETQRRIIQSRLTQLGHDTNGVDGKFGPGTRRAITAWQAAKGRTATGFLSKSDADAILNAGVMPEGGVTPAAPVDGSTAGNEAAAAAELALNLTRDQRIEIQRGLAAAGHDTRGIDGQFGSGTRRAIGAWQTARGDAATGYLTRAQSDALRAGRPVVATPAATGSATAVPAWAGPTATDEAALNLGAPERTQVQTRLSALGYDPKGVDGKFGPGSRAAIRSWQGDNGWAETGYLNAEQLSRLRGQRRD